MVVTLGQKYNTGEKPTVMLEGHEGHRTKIKQKHFEYIIKKVYNYIQPNGLRTIKSLVHKIRPYGRRRKGITAESFSREKLRHAPQKEGG